MTVLTLDQIAEKAKRHTITPAEKRAQRVSLISGVLDSNTTLTRAHVVDLLNQIEGQEVPTNIKPKGR